MVYLVIKSTKIDEYYSGKAKFFLKFTNFTESFLEVSLSLLSYLQIDYLPCNSIFGKSLSSFT